MTRSTRSRTRSSGACVTAGMRCDLLALQRGWSPETYGAFLAETLIDALLPSQG